MQRALSGAPGQAVHAAYGTVGTSLMSGPTGLFLRPCPQRTRPSSPLLRRTAMQQPADDEPTARHADLSLRRHRPAAAAPSPPPPPPAFLQDADKEILAALKAAGRLVDHGAIVHSYPFCWRSDTPLIYKAVPSWFVRVEEIKPRVSSRASVLHTAVHWCMCGVREKDVRAVMVSCFATLWIHAC